MQCCGIKKDGERCAVLVTDGQRCKTHVKTFEKVGPNQIRRDELKHAHERRMNMIRTANAGNRTQPEAERPRLLREFRAHLRTEELHYQEALHALEATIDLETEANNGLDADVPYRERQREVERQRRAVHEERWRIRNEHLRLLHAQRGAFPNAVQFIDQRQPNGGLGNLARDNQNVHTAVVVTKVKETIQRVLQIPVPPEYQTETLKTSGEIILECKLTKRSAWQMMAKYCGDENIYELGHGIYARVLNSVWQYIKASPDAADLKKILASEMEDNIGMCAQGNLSRLCNILSGYLDGLVVETKSRNELIGERFAALMNIDDIDERLSNGHDILREFNVHADEYHAWLMPLTED
jgi:hypothetical protein